MLKRWRVPHKLVVGLCMVVVAGFATSVAVAGTWAEVGDAGDLPATAQVPVGSGSLDSITGSVSVDGDANMYRVCLTGGGTFSATTVGTPGTLGDPQLFLFDEDGMGVEANDDVVGSLDAELPAGGLSPSEAGVYYLAMSDFDNDPVSPGGLIFPSFPFTPVYGPTGPGGGSAISGWTGGFGTGTYTIALTGARFCEQQVVLDIKPGPGTNPINLKSKGLTPIAILTTPDFDATTIDVSSACFGDGPGDWDCTEAHGTGHYEDVDGDGDTDLVLHYNTQELGLDAGDTQACFSASTIYGETASDCDSITIVP